jgi:hypothetical protein
VANQAKSIGRETIFMVWRIPKHEEAVLRILLSMARTPGRAFRGSNRLIAWGFTVSFSSAGLEAIDPGGLSNFYQKED